ncbi:MAG: NFACT RNA binding domain-containing protein [bacterium]
MKIKKFRSSAGLEIWVGMDDASNDALSFDLGHANDIWLHVSGAPGSHVILRCGEDKITPDRDSLKQAASLAAWFSKMRHGGKVPVSYCLLQQVSKPRRARTGTVNIRQAQKMLVRPALLEEIR